MKNFEKIEIDKIRIPEKSRKHQPEAVVSLALSIQMVGLIHPIIVVRMEDGFYQLCSGLFRVRAMQKLGQKEIDAFVHEPGEINCQKIGVEDNLMRAPLTQKEIAKLTARRNELLILIEQERRKTLENEK